MPYASPSLNRKLVADSDSMMASDLKVAVKELDLSYRNVERDIYIYLSNNMASRL